MSVSSMADMAFARRKDVGNPDEGLRTLDRVAEERGQKPETAHHGLIGDCRHRGIRLVQPGGRRRRGPHRVDAARRLRAGLRFRLAREQLARTASHVNRRLPTARRARRRAASVPSSGTPHR